MTVYENIQTASDRKDLGAFGTDLVWPGNEPLPPHAIAAIREFMLEPHLGSLVGDLPYGTRRLVGIGPVRGGGSIGLAPRRAGSWAQ